MMLPQFVEDRERRIAEKLSSLQGDPELDIEAAQ
jgi:hypothetical protein